MLVTNDPSAVLRLSGFDSWRHCLPPKLGIDSFRSRLPLLVTGDRPPVIVAKEIDRTNLEGLRNPGVEFIFHSPYFTFDAVERPASAHADVGSALASLADGHAVELDPRLPLQLYGDLERAVGGAKRASIGRFVPPAHRYVVTEPKNRLPSSRSDPEVRAAAGRVADDLGAARTLREWLGRPPDDRFATLDSLLDDAGIDAILASTPVNVQQLSGIPALLLPDEVYATYVRGSHEIDVYSRPHLGWFSLPEPETSSSGGIADRVGKYRLGVEEEDLTQEAFEGLGLASLAIAPATAVLRRWRELRTWEDLPYYILGAHITVTGIEAALRLVADLDHTDNPASEMAAYRRYREVVADKLEEGGVRDPGAPVLHSHPRRQPVADPGECDRPPASTPLDAQDRRRPRGV